MKLRECDDWGCGHYGAPRGTRKHKGIDIPCPPGERVHCLNGGIVTDIGHAYADDLSFRIVDITNGGYRWRYFYVEPIVNVGDYVDAYTVIGHDQHVAERYRKRDPTRRMENHTHLEVIKDGQHIDPTTLVSE